MTTSSKNSVLSKDLFSSIDASKSTAQLFANQLCLLLCDMRAFVERDGKHADLGLKVFVGVLADAAECQLLEAIEARKLADTSLNGTCGVILEIVANCDLCEAIIPIIGAFAINFTRFLQSLPGQKYSAVIRDFMQVIEPSVAATLEYQDAREEFIALGKRPSFTKLVKFVGRT